MIAARRSAEQHDGGETYIAVGLFVWLGLIGLGVVIDKAGPPPPDGWNWAGLGAGWGFVIGLVAWPTVLVLAWMLGRIVWLARWAFRALRQLRPTPA